MSHLITIYTNDAEYKIWLAAFNDYIKTTGHTQESFLKCSKDEFNSISRSANRVANLAVFNAKLANGGKSL